MSQENVEIVRSAFAEFERGNFRALEVFDPSIRIVWLPVFGVETESVGLDEMARTMKEWIEAWEQVTCVAEQLIDAREDQVVVLAEWRGRGKASGVSTTWPFGAVYTLRDGRVVRVDEFTDRAEALEAAGLAD